jgi:hypothetical protein
MFDPGPSDVGPSQPTPMATDPPVAQPTPIQATTPASSSTAITAQGQSVSQAPPSTLGKEERLSIKDLAAITSAAQRFEKLDDTNWIAWKDNMTNLLDMCELDSEGHIKSTAQCPDPITDPLGAKYWRRQERAACAMITGSVDRSQNVHIPKEDENGEKPSAYQVWQALKEHNQPRGTIATFEMLREFWNKRAYDDTNLSKHLDEMIEYRTELEMMGNRIPDNQFT